MFLFALFARLFFGRGFFFQRVFHRIQFLVFVRNEPSVLLVQLAFHYNRFIKDGLSLMQHVLLELRFGFLLRALVRLFHSCHRDGALLFHAFHCILVRAALLGRRINRRRVFFSFVVYNAAQLRALRLQRTDFGHHFSARAVHAVHFQMHGAFFFGRHDDDDDDGKRKILHYPNLILCRF